MDLIHASYLLLLGLVLHCVCLLCFYSKADLVVTMETVKSQLGRPNAAFTKKRWRGREGEREKRQREERKANQNQPIL
jgi:hypothetical protein